MDLVCQWQERKFTKKLYVVRTYTLPPKSNRQINVSIYKSKNIFRRILMISIDR